MTAVIISPSLSRALFDCCVVVVVFVVVVIVVCRVVSSPSPYAKLFSLQSLPPSKILRLIVVYAFISSMSPFPPPPPTSPLLTIATTAAPTKATEFRGSAQAGTSTRAARRAAIQNLIRMLWIKY
jgi:hypothetical protein